MLGWSRRKWCGGKGAYLCPERRLVMGSGHTRADTALRFILPFIILHLARREGEGGGVLLRGQGEEVYGLWY